MEAEEVRPRGCLVYVGELGPDRVSCVAVEVRNGPLRYCTTHCARNGPGAQDNGEEEGQAQPLAGHSDRHRQERDANAGPGGPGGPEASSHSTRVAPILFASLMSTA